MESYKLILGVLCTWRVTHLLANEDGPWKILKRARETLETRGWGDVLSCFYCLSLWIGIPFALSLSQGYKERMLLWPALSGGAILLERLVSRESVPPAVYMESDDIANGGTSGMLWEARAGSGRESRAGR